VERSGAGAAGMGKLEDARVLMRRRWRFGRRRAGAGEPGRRALEIGRTDKGDGDLAEAARLRSQKLPEGRITTWSENVVRAGESAGRRIKALRRPLRSMRTFRRHITTLGAVAVVAAEGSRKRQSVSAAR